MPHLLKKTFVLFDKELNLLDVYKRACLAYGLYILWNPDKNDSLVDAVFIIEKVNITKINKAKYEIVDSFIYIV